MSDFTMRRSCHQATLRAFARLCISCLDDNRVSTAWSSEWRSSVRSATSGRIGSRYLGALMISLCLSLWAIRGVIADLKGLVPQVEDPGLVLLRVDRAALMWVNYWSLQCWGSRIHLWCLIYRVFWIPRFGNRRGASPCSNLIIGFKGGHMVAA